MAGIEDGIGYVDDALVLIGIVLAITGSSWGLALIAVGLVMMFASGDFFGTGKSPFSSPRAEEDERGEVDEGEEGGGEGEGGDADAE